MVIRPDCKRESCSYYQKCPQIATTLVTKPGKDYFAVFVGQGGGAEEETTSLPFVGASGARLRVLIDLFATVHGNQFSYILSNTIRCRPPGNRIPFEHEVDECLTFLFRDIRKLKPHVIIALGKSAFDDLTGFGLTLSMAQANGNLYDLKASLCEDYGFETAPRVMPLYHPSAIIRQNRTFNASRLLDYEKAFLKGLKVAWWYSYGEEL